MASILPSIVVMLFCISSHSCKCTARGLLHKDMAEKKNQPLNTKENDEKLNPSRVFEQPEEKASTPNATGDAKEENINEKPKIINSEPIILDEAAGKHSQETTKVDSTDVSDAAKSGSASYVSWRVPHKKRGGEQEPGFNLDYLPPKTHPPVHN